MTLFVRSDPLDRDPSAAIAARVAEVFAGADAARMRELDELIRTGSRCRYCDRRLNGEGPREFPGVCSRKPCKRRAAEDERIAQEKRAEAEKAAVVVEEPPAHPAPAQPEEEAMACSECGSKTIHKATCSKRPGGPNGRPLTGAEHGLKAARTAREAVARLERSVAVHRGEKVLRVAARGLEVGREALDTLTIDALVERRGAYREAVAAIEEELRRRQDEIAKALGPRAPTAATGT